MVRCAEAKAGILQGKMRRGRQTFSWVLVKVSKPCSATASHSSKEVGVRFKLTWLWILNRVENEWQKLFRQLRDLEILNVQRQISRVHDSRVIRSLAIRQTRM
jgi:hypothetical protein